MQTLASFETNKKTDKALENNPELNTFYLEELFKETKSYENSFSKFWKEDRKMITFSFISVCFLSLPVVYHFADNNSIYLLWLILLVLSLQIFFVKTILLFAKYKGYQEIAFSFVDLLKTIHRKLAFNNEASFEKNKDIKKKEKMMDNIDKMLVFLIFIITVLYLMLIKMFCFFSIAIKFFLLEKKTTSLKINMKKQKNTLILLLEIFGIF